MKNEICEKLGIEFPIFAFSHCRDVVAAVSKAGGLGVLGAVAFSPEELERELQWIDAHIDGKPYGVDTVIPAEYVGKAEGDFDRAVLDDLIPEDHQAFIDELLERFGVPRLPDGVDAFDGLLGWSASGGRAHVDVAMRHPIKLIANALGPPPADVIERAHGAGVTVAALCGTVPQAMAQKRAGVDIIVASGHEAGGHTGEVGSMVLLPQVVDAVHPTPVLAAGGIGSGRQMAAALALGARGVWTGSIWLTTAESDCIPELKEKLVQADSRHTVRSRCISGKPARQLKTAYTQAWDGSDSPGALPMPLQFLATADATQRIHHHARAGVKGAQELLGTPVGQVVGQMNQVKPAGRVVLDLIEEYMDTVARLGEELEGVE